MPTARTTIRRHPERGEYDRSPIDSILDEALDYRRDYRRPDPSAAHAFRA